MSSYQWGRKGGHFALAFCLSFFSGANAVADDTEIYFGASTAGTIRPNILFIMDTSGSMSTTVSGTTKSRLQTMQEALTDILDSVDNVNVGLMRYSAPSNTDNNGGPVLYPVKYIDDPAVEPAISATVSAASDDASEAIASPFDVVLNETCLPLSTATASAAPGAGELINGVAVALPSAAKDNLKYYTINVPTGTTNLTVTTTGGTGDADLFLRFGSNPTTSTYDCRGVSGTSNETCSIDSPSVGIYYVMVQAWSAYSGVTLTGTHDGTVCYAPTSGQRQVGIRFAGVNVPKGATITRAYLEVASATTASDAASLTIKAHKVGDSTTFTNTVTNISARPATTAVVNWTPGTWTLGGTYQSPDLKNVVQEIVNQSTWCGGNAMSLLIAGTGNRLIQSFEVGKNPPRLVVEYDESSAAGGCVIKSFLRQLSDKNDDAFQSDNGAITRDSSLNFKQNYWLGTRFRSIDIPKNATIVSASLELTASNTETGTISGLIYAEQNDNAGNFPKKKGTNNISGRAGGTSAALSIPSWNRDTSYQSGNIGPQIQAIVNRAGWSSGNSLVLVTKITGLSANTSIVRTAYSIENSASSAAKLRITYKGSYQANAQRVRDHLKTTVANFTNDGYTPISGTLAEAALYFRGDEVHYGLRRGVNGSNQGSAQFRTSHPSSYAGGADVLPSGCPSWDSSNANCAGEVLTGSPRYTSPITETCQSNHILFLSDGEPNAHGSVTADVVRGITGESCRSNDSGRECSTKLAAFLSGNDQSSTLPGDQFVKVHTISFASDIPLMRDIASAGQGLYAQANNKADLISAFQAVVKTAMDTSSSFVSAGITVNQTNRLTNADQLYFSLFKPQEQPAWPGNLKRYRLDPTGVIVDADSLAAVDSASGRFKDTSRSWWTLSDDGNDVRLGGAAGQMALPRKVYTNINASQADLTHTTNAVTDTNTLITRSMLNAADDAERTKVLSWAKGIDVMDVDNDGSTTDVRAQMGDPLHSRPTIVSFDTGSGTRNLIFVGTNQGYLHAFDTTSGQEQWSFIPKELLGNLLTYMDNSGGSRPFGLDGQISLLHVDTDNDHLVDTNETAILYVGMRRGGKNYYAIDISNPNAPKIKFVIQGGIAGTDYAELGETWSQAKPRKIMWNGTSKQVLIFGGGYDPAQDSAGSAPANDSIGRTVFVADALTGARLWSARDHAVAPPSPATAASSAMNASIPADVTTIDINGDGIVDMLYAADLAGKVFRFDLNAVNSSASNFAVGGRIAHLNANTVAGNRRFYYAPDVSMVARSGDNSFLAVALGSGYRAHPLNTQTSEHFYMLKDYGALRTTVSSGRTVREFRDYSLSNLVDVSLEARDSTADAAIDAAALANPDNNGGWYIDFTRDRGDGTTVGGVGEKTVAQSLTVNDTIIFSTYVPPAAVAGACVPREGQGKLYYVDIMNGTPIARMITDINNPNIDERHTGATTGMPTGPLAMFTENKMIILEGRNVYEAPPSPSGAPLEIFNRTQTRQGLYTDGDIPAASP